MWYFITGLICFLVGLVCGVKIEVHMRNAVRKVARDMIKDK